MNFFGKFSTVISERRTNSARFSINEIVSDVKEKFASVGSRFGQIKSSVNTTHDTPENIVRQVESDSDALSNSQAYHASLRSDSSAEWSVEQSIQNDAICANQGNPNENNSVPPGSYVTTSENMTRVKIDKASVHYHNYDATPHHNTKLPSAIKECNSEITVIWGKMDRWGKMSQYFFLTLKYCERNWGHVSASIFFFLLTLNIFLSRKKVLALLVVFLHS